MNPAGQSPGLVLKVRVSGRGRVFNGGGSALASPKEVKEVWREEAGKACGYACGGVREWLMGGVDD